MLADVKKSASDRDKVTKWLDFIHEHNPACREEVLEACKTDIEARKYYVGRHEEINANRS